MMKVHNWYHIIDRGLNYTCVFRADGDTCVTVLVSSAHGLSQYCRQYWHGGGGRHQFITGAALHTVISVAFGVVLAWGCKMKTAPMKRDGVVDLEKCGAPHLAIFFVIFD